MKLVDQSKTQSKEPGVGRPIVHIFRFEAIKRGDGVLLLHYVRSQEKPDPDKPDPNEQQFDLHVTIH
jgi:predicted secreted protein